MPEPFVPVSAHSKPVTRRFALRHRAHAGTRGPLWSALSVLLAATGCAPPGAKAPEAATAPFRAELKLPPGMDVLALDRPGFGRSGPAGAMVSLSDQAAAVLALMPEGGRPVVLLGHSLGGPIVARVAADHPDRVAGLVLLAASLDPALEAIHPLQYVGAWGLVKPLLPRMLRNANAELMALKPELESLALALPRITAKVVIGADGARSMTRACAGGPAPGPRAIAIRGYAPTPSARAGRQIIRYGERPQPSYAWAFDRGDGLSNVGSGELADRTAE